MLPEVKQTIAASATFPPLLEDFVTRYMINPMRISAGRDTFLIGIRQFISVVPSHLSVFVQMKNKMAELLRILSVVPFKQCLVFSNYQSRAESICNKLNKEGWPAVYISGSQNQSVRLKAMSSLKEFRCRVLLSTDLTSRGIDAENVNLIINLDLPYDGATYMHRIGRAGRYGTYGLAITILQTGFELEQFRKMLNEIGGGDFRIALFPNGKLELDVWNAKDEDFESVPILEGEYKYSRTKRNEEKVHESRSPAADEEETKSMAVEKLSTCLLTLPEERGLHDYEELVELFSKFQPQEENPIALAEEDLSYEDYSSELKSCLLFLEEEAWRKQREVLEPGLKRSEGGSEERINHLDDSENESKQDETEEEEEEEWEEEEKEWEAEEEEEEEEEEGHCGSESDDWGSSDSEEALDQDSFYIKQWYSIWYSQLSAVRRYVNYLKYSHYWNEIFNQR